MGRTKNRAIAKETLKIIEDGCYYINHEKFELRYSNRSYEEIEVFSPKVVRNIEDDVDEFFERAFYGHKFCEFYVVNMDSYQAANCFGADGDSLVLNFANAHHPGGGFINGASAQEESLCRCSTLFASINSREAREMYDYNNQNRNSYDSDYMMISPCVEVFRSPDGELLADSFITSVITTPAPNLCGLAKDVDRDELDRIMRAKIRSFLYVAAREGYDTLVLGAWGCGAFGHDAKKVANYFYEILVEEKFYQFFSKVIFAVYDISEDKYNYNSFKERFGEDGLWKMDNADISFVKVEYKVDTVDENGNTLYGESAIAKTKDELKELLDIYLEMDSVKRIVIEE